jgi:hypothetical protein
LRWRFAVGREKWESVAVDAATFHENVAISTFPGGSGVDWHADVPIVGSNLVRLPSGCDGFLSIAWHNNER